MHFSLLLLLSLQSCLILSNPIDGSPPGSPIPGILQARALEWVAISFSNACMKVKSESEVAQSCPTLSNPMDRSFPGSSVHGIFQARVLEWGAIAFSAFLSMYILLVISLENPNTCKYSNSCAYSFIQQIYIELSAGDSDELCPH